MTKPPSNCPIPPSTTLNELLLLKPDEIILRLNRFAANTYTYFTPIGGKPSARDPTLTIRCDHHGSPTLKSYWRSQCEHAITFKPKKRSQKVGDGPWIIAGEVKGHNHGPKGKRGDYRVDGTKKVDKVEAEKKTERAKRANDSDDDSLWHFLSSELPEEISGTRVDGDRLATSSGTTTSKPDENHGKAGGVSESQLKYWNRSLNAQCGKTATTTGKVQGESPTSSSSRRDPLDSLPSSSGSSPSVVPISPPTPSSSTFKSTLPISSSQNQVSASPHSTTNTATDTSQSLMKFMSTPTYQADLQVKYDDLFIAHEKAEREIETLKKANQVLIEENIKHKKTIKSLEEKVELSKKTTTYTTHKQCKDTESKLRESLTEADTKIQDLSSALKARDELDKLKDEEEKMKMIRENEKKEREKEENKRKAEENKRKEEDRKRKIKMDNEERKLGEKRRKLLESVEKGRSHC